MKKMLCFQLQNLPIQKMYINTEKNTGNRVEHFQFFSFYYLKLKFS